MFTRGISIRLKPGRIVAFTKSIEDKIFPLPRKPKDFQDAIAWFVAGRIEQKEQLQGAA
jgi:hypothetical protein